MHDVIIIGGGPVGIALAIELGLQGTKTLVLEKYDAPLPTPRAQSLNARTMEFFLRWNIDKELEARILLPPNFPQQGVWCSTLNGITYFAGKCGDNDFQNNESPKQAVRIPLWITEEVLRNRLNDFSCVTLLKNHEVQDIKVYDDHVILQVLDRIHENIIEKKGLFLACCDGTLGPSKELLGNYFKSLSECSRILSISFTSYDIVHKKRVPDGIFYSVLTKEISGFLSPIDLKKGSWLAQVVWTQSEILPSVEQVSDLLVQMVGESFEKEIAEYHFWNMQVQLAELFSLQNRVFWLGDAAHAFAPTGGLGLNTGFGDAQNLGWKLTYVLRKNAPPSLLSTYEQERYPIWINNLAFAKKNADDFLKIKQFYPIDQDLDAFGRANGQLGKQFLNSSKLSLGYCYGFENQTNFEKDKLRDFQYKPIDEIGYFLPHTSDEEGVSIYNKLSPINWNLIVNELDNTKLQKIEQFQWQNSIISPHIVNVAPKSYTHKFLLVRPDWHISKVGDKLQDF